MILKKNINIIYKVKKEDADAKDGERITISLAYKKGIKKIKKTFCG